MSFVTYKIRFVIRVMLRWVALLSIRVTQEYHSAAALSSSTQQRHSWGCTPPIALSPTPLCRRSRLAAARLAPGKQSTPCVIHWARIHLIQHL